MFTHFTYVTIFKFLYIIIVINTYIYISWIKEKQNGIDYYYSWINSKNIK